MAATGEAVMVEAREEVETEAAMAAATGEVAMAAVKGEAAKAVG